MRRYGQARMHYVGLWSYLLGDWHGAARLPTPPQVQVLRPVGLLKATSVGACFPPSPLRGGAAGIQGGRAPCGVVTCSRTIPSPPLLTLARRRCCWRRVTGGS